MTLIMAKHPLPTTFHSTTGTTLSWVILKFPETMLKREKVTGDDLVIDPFMGSGTTLVVCKSHRIPSAGIDANNFMVDAARVKLNWDIDITDLKKCSVELLEHIRKEFARYNWDSQKIVN